MLEQDRARSTLRLCLRGGGFLCKAVNDAWVAGNNRLKEGGGYDTEVLYALFKLNRIWTQHSRSIVDIWADLDLVFK